MSWRTSTRFLIGCTLLLGCASIVMAQDETPTSVFQLNGFAGSNLQPGSDNLTDPNPLTTTPPGGPCDYGSGPTEVCDNWNSLFNKSQNHSANSEFFPASTLVFKQGSKDTQDVTQWVWTPGSSPGKDTFNEGYAANYSGPYTGDNIVIAGADRASPNGDANIGIWLLQLPVTTAVTPKGVGFFTCGQALCHANHDIFIISAFTGGGGSSAIEVLEWDTACSSVNTTVKNPTAGQCADTNLRLLLALGSQCAGSFECAVTNPATTHTAWEGAVGTPQFFEGGVNVTKALDIAGVSSDVCFATIEIETRASQSTGAELKAFFLHAFPTCKMQMGKSCTVNLSATPPTPRIVSSGNASVVHYDFSISLFNNGGATVWDPTVSDTFPSGTTNRILNGSACSSSPCTVALTGTSIAKGDTQTITGSFEFNATGKITNQITATAAPSPGGTQSITALDVSGNTPTTADFGTAACQVSPSTLLTLKKYCDITLTTGSAVSLRQDDIIRVCNDPSSNTPISSISLSNVVKFGTSTTSDLTDTSFSVPTLQPGDCATFNPTYVPKRCVNSVINPTVSSVDGSVQTNTDAGRCEFQDTVSISSAPKDGFGNPVTTPLPQTGTCYLCLSGNANGTFCIASTN